MLPSVLRILRLTLSLSALVSSFSLATSSTTAGAFEFDPEYQSLATQSGFALVDPTSIDSEYQSDVLTYSLSPRTMATFLRQRFALSTDTQGSVHISAGSLSATQFDQKLRAEILSPLNSTFRFKFLRTEHQNYEENSSHSIFELEGRLIEFNETDGLYFSAYGEVTRQKREDDVGFALLRRKTTQNLQGSETRLFVTFADFTRSDRNDAGDRFVNDKEPLVFGLTHREATTRSFTDVFIRRESSVEWNDPAASKTFFYARTTAGFLWFLETSPDSPESISLRGQWDRTKTGLQTTTNGSFEISDRDRLQIEARKTQALSDSLDLETGFLWTARHWIDEAGRKLFHDNAVPFLWLKHQSGFEVGAEATEFRRHGDASLGSATTRDSATESRLNARYRIPFSKDAELLLALTLDVDRAEGGAFEGGHGQFTMNF